MARIGSLIWTTQIFFIVFVCLFQSYLNKPAQRYFLPVKMQPFCLSCHGVPANNPLNAGKPEAQWSNIDRTGFPMENWTLKDFGGGISITFFDK